MAVAAPESTTSSACTAVFDTYELLEKILLDVPAKNVICAASRVNQAWHSVIESSIPINKHIFSDLTITSRLRSRRPDRVSLAVADFFWGGIIIKCLEHTELVYTFDRSLGWGYEPEVPSAFTARFLNKDEFIQTLITQDQERFKHDGWKNALKDWYAARDGQKFYTRFEIALYKHIDPVYGTKAEQIYEAYETDTCERGVPPLDTLERCWSIRSHYTHRHDPEQWEAQLEHCIWIAQNSPRI